MFAWYFQKNLTWYFQRKPNTLRIAKTLAAAVTAVVAAAVAMKKEQRLPCPK